MNRLARTTKMCAAHPYIERFKPEREQGKNPRFNRRPRGRCNDGKVATNPSVNDKYITVSMPSTHPNCAANAGSDAFTVSAPAKV